jgi:hypothetical protein
MEVIRTLNANTSFGTLFPFARGFSLLPEGAIAIPKTPEILSGF